MDHAASCKAERAIADIRGQALSRRGYVRCCRGRDTVPRTWSTLFRYLKAAYRKGLKPEYGRDLSLCPCQNSDGYDAVMKVAYECGLVPSYDYIKDCVSSNALVSAYRHGLTPCRRHFAAFDDHAMIVPVLAAAYAAGYKPDPDRDFYDRDWDHDQLCRAWRDAVEYGAAIDMETIHGLGDYSLLGVAYVRGGIAPVLEHVPTFLEHDEAALPHAYRAGLPFDFYGQIAMLTDETVAADALAAAYSCGAHPEAYHLQFVAPQHFTRVKDAARVQLRREYAVRSVFGPDIGGLVVDRMSP
jgi:hypothetical protein